MRGWIVLRWVVACLGLLAGCVEPSLVPCGDLLCPVENVCTPGGCATPDEAAACSTLEEGADCSTPEIVAGTCLGGACRSSVCGDGRRDPHEVCDDGNTVAGDDCSILCDSTESCGNGVVDLVRGEECDSGVPNLSSDGCSSRCKLEVATWAEVTPQQIAPRAGVAMAYDPARARTVLFGGYTALGPSDETWELFKRSWSQRQPLVSPSPRRDAMMATSPMNGGVLLFGGLANAGVSDDTWVWNGGTWMQLTPTVRPPARASAAMVLDRARGRVVLYGGWSGTRALDDTWEWDGVKWTERVLDVRPPAVFDAASAYDDTRQRVVLYGGSSNGGLSAGTWEYSQDEWKPIGMNAPTSRSSGELAWHPVSGLVLFGGIADDGRRLDETWRFDGTTWVDVSAVDRPSVRTDFGLVFNVAENALEMFGGYDYTTMTNLRGDTWAWNGSLWALTPPSERSPTKRAHAATAYDSKRGRIVLVAGRDAATGSLEDTWAWDERGWTRINANGPPRRAGHMLAYDRARDRVVLFGGESVGTPLNDLWEHDGMGWTKRIVAAPPGRFDAAMIHDDARGVTLLFGGSGVGGMLSDTWTWDGAIWTQRTSPTKPAARRAPGVAYDPVRRVVVLFGGRSGASALDDTWEWDGAAWTQRTPSQAPPARSFHGMTYDPQRQRVIAVGGLASTTASLDDVWEWDGTTWTELVPQQRLTTHAYTGLTYDPVQRQALVFGGVSFLGDDLADTWALRFGNATQPKERCADADEDGDGDGLGGCADPDCWARCAPACPPATSCPVGAATCGDGTCSDLEDHTLCPADCP